MLLKKNGQLKSWRVVSKVFGAYPTMFMKTNKIYCLSYDVYEK